MKNLDMAAKVLVVVGALNWGFIGLAGLNVVEAVLRSAPQIVQFVYILVGLSGLYMLGRLNGKK